jgi:pantoate--beta-alanine ligase
MQMYKIDRFGSKIILYAPTVEDIYEGKPTSHFDFDGLAKWKANSDRPFDGVGTIVKRLLK